MSHRSPSYPNDADYTTNAPSYYEDLARKQALIQELANRIWTYEEQLKLSKEEITARFIEWDAKIAGFDGDVNVLLQEWIADGTFDDIINVTILGWKANQTDLDSTNQQVLAKVDKTGVGQVTWANIAQDARTQISSGNTAIVGTDSVSTVNVVNKAITQPKVGFKYLTGVIKQGTLNVDTVANVITATANAGVYVEGMNKYYTYATAQTIAVPSTTGLFAIYFNYVTKLYEAYANGQALINSQDLVFITTFWYQDKKFTGATQDDGALLVNGNKASTLSAMAFLITGGISINTTTKIMTITPSNIITTNGFEGVSTATTIDYSALDSTRAINIHWDTKTSTFKLFQYSDAAQKGTGLYLFGTLYLSKVYGSLAKEFITVNGVVNAGYGSGITLVESSALKSPEESFHNFMNITGAKRLKLIGDSITHGVGGTGYKSDGTVSGSVLIPSTTVYTSPLSVSWANKLRDDVKKLDSQIETINYGISGKDSAYVNTNKGVLIDANDDLVILMIGTNDTIAASNRTIPQIVANIQAIIDHCINVGSGIVVMSSFPFTSNSSATYDKSMYQVNQAIKKAANSRGVKHINLYAKILDYAETKGIAYGTLLGDGLHPNDTLYDLMYHWITKELGISYSTY